MLGGLAGLARTLLPCPFRAEFGDELADVAYPPGFRVIAARRDLLLHLGVPQLEVVLARSPCSPAQQKAQYAGASGRSFGLPRVGRR